MGSKELNQTNSTILGSLSYLYATFAKAETSLSPGHIFEFIIILCYSLFYLIYVVVLLSDIGDALEMSRCELSSDTVDWQNCDKVESLAGRSIKALKIKRFVDIGAHMMNPCIVF